MDAPGAWPGPAALELCRRSVPAGQDLNHPLWPAVTASSGGAWPPAQGRGQQSLHQPPGGPLLVRDQEPLLGVVRGRAVSRLGQDVCVRLLLESL